ncbi:hypothetical protein TNIN_319331 [Trichonephila inaurata madagascariensis]|uniref:Uncharacterized protein n=1 Tax=Trichonephila inaurata madagascariensis TaxID=2747483 RepID=A0A8X6MG05_9ARAC|nr:hypothetical protein TNIN_319331 [Trichonephila inaurata madagascariensis]
MNGPWFKGLFRHCRRSFVLGILFVFSRGPHCILWGLGGKISGFALTISRGKGYSLSFSHTHSDNQRPADDPLTGSRTVPLQRLRTLEEA